MAGRSAFEDSCLVLSVTYGVGWEECAGPDCHPSDRPLFVRASFFHKELREALHLLFRGSTGTRGRWLPFKGLD